jgi:hypothetical protein
MRAATPRIARPITLRRLSIAVLAWCLRLLLRLLGTLGRTW